MRTLLAAAALAVAVLAPAQARAADACPNAPLRTGAQASLPDCRAYEQVSPVDKRGNAMNPVFTSYSGATGDRFVSGSFGGAVGTDGAPQNRSLLSVRGADWSTRGTDPPLTPPDLAGTLATLWLSDDATKAIVISPYALTPDAVEGRTNLYFSDLTQPDAYTLALAIPDRGLYDKAVQGAGLIYDATSDLSTFVIRTDSVVNAESPDPALVSLYIVHAGRATLASRQPDGTPVASESSALSATNALSDDGRILTWKPLGGDADGNVRLYRTERDGRTTELSESTLPGQDTAKVDTPFTTPDGRWTVFANRGALTPESVQTQDAEALYRYDAADGTLEDLTAQTLRDSGLPPEEGLALAVQSLSPDGALVFFTTKAPLLPDDAGPNDLRLYSLDVATRRVRRAAIVDIDYEVNFRAIDFRTSPDGRRVLLGTVAPLTGDDVESESCSTTGGRCPQVYTWNAREPDRPVLCVSCVPGGRQRSPASITVPGKVPAGNRLNRAITDDGRVFFTASARLVASDTDAVADVYEYTPGVGPSLLSAGNSGLRAQFADLSPDGRSAFFHTAQRLVAQDSDDLVDVYVARTDGGIASQRVAPAAPAAPCVAETCRPAPSAPPARPVQASADPAPPKALVPSFRVLRPSAAALRTAARRGRLTVSVRVNAPGTIAATLRSRLGGRRLRTVASGTRKATRAQTVRVALRLSKAARARLRAGRRLSVQLTVAYSERLTRSRTTLTIRKGGAR